MRLEPGTRVRCVDPGFCPLVTGTDYTIETSRYFGLVTLHGVRGEYMPERFKPIVRVKAVGVQCNP